MKRLITLLVVTIFIFGALDSSFALWDKCGMGLKEAEAETEAEQAAKTAKEEKVQAKEEKVQAKEEKPQAKEEKPQAQTQASPVKAKIKAPEEGKKARVGTPMPMRPVNKEICEIVKELATIVGSLSEVKKDSKLKQKINTIIVRCDGLKAEYEKMTPKK